MSCVLLGVIPYVLLGLLIIALLIPAVLVYKKLMKSKKYDELGKALTEEPNFDGISPREMMSEIREDSQSLKDKAGELEETAKGQQAEAKEIKDFTKKIGGTINK